MKLLAINTDTSENILLFVFQYSTPSSITPLYKTQTRYMSACQPTFSKQTSSGCIIADLAFALAPIGQAEMCVYQWFSKWICNSANFPPATSCTHLAIFIVFVRLSNRIPRWYIEMCHGCTFSNM